MREIPSQRSSNTSYANRLRAFLAHPSVKRLDRSVSVADAIETLRRIRQYERTDPDLRRIRELERNARRETA